MTHVRIRYKVGLNYLTRRAPLPELVLGIGEVVKNLELERDGSRLSGGNTIGLPVGLQHVGHVAQAQAAGLRDPDLG
jgi:hypothetical protein